MPSVRNSSRVVATRPGDFMTFVAFLFYFLPKNLISWLTGALARVRWPRPLSTWLCKAFVKIVKIDMAEAEFAIDHYNSIEDVFTRRLKPGSRPIVAPVCSPADGYLARSEPATNQTAVQAKGLSYPLDELVFGETAEVHPFHDLSWYTTIYLAPHNYHRVHAPISGRLHALRYLPGELWPVNATFVKRIPRLFNRNERLVFDFELEDGGRVFAVMVGALNVGRIQTPFDPDLITNSLDRQLGARPVTHRFETPLPVNIGDEIGTFMLGSTVILVFDRKAASQIELVRAAENSPILMGQSLLTSSLGQESH